MRCSLHEHCHCNVTSVKIKILNNQAPSVVGFCSFIMRKGTLWMMHHSALYIYIQRPVNVLSYCQWIFRNLCEQWSHSLCSRILCFFSDMIFFSFERVFNCIAHLLLIFNNNFISCVEWGGQDLQYLVLVINFFLSWLNEYYNYKRRQKYKLAGYFVGTCWFIGFCLGKAKKRRKEKKQISESVFEALAHVFAIY